MRKALLSLALLSGALAAVPSTVTDTGRSNPYLTAGPLQRKPPAKTSQDMIAAAEEKRRRKAARKAKS